MLRQALDDAIACGALAPSESYTLKAEYSEVEQMLDRPARPDPGADGLRGRFSVRVHRV